MIWLSPQQLKDLGVSKGILFRNRDNWTFRKTGERGRNGKQVEECLLESMQTQWKEAWLQMQPSSLVPDHSSLIDSSLTTEQVPATDDRPDAVDADRSGTEGERRFTEALKRYDLRVRDAFRDEALRLSGIVEQFDRVSPKRQKVKGKFEFVPAVERLCEQAVCTDTAILAVEPSRGKPKSPHTLEAWSKQYRVDGLATFLRKPPEKQKLNDGREAKISEGAIQWINANYRKKPSAERLWKDCKKEAAKHGWTIPARGWFWRKYQQIPEITRTLIYDGQKAYTGKFAPYVPRDYRDLAALQIICGDHSVRDVTVMLPDGSLTRPWLTLWQDLRTGLIWGWHLDLTPSSQTIGLAYANGVQTFGAQPIANPDADFYSYLYTDQGKDYRCKQITGQTLEFQDVNYKAAARIDGGLNALCTQRRVGLMDEMGVKHLMARGYNAREKFIERTHKDISEWEKNTFENEYCGRGIGHKPEQWQKSWHKHKKLQTKVGKNLDWLAAESPFMPIDVYREYIGTWITEYNHSEHTRSVLGGATVVPVHEYERLYTTRYEISEDTLAMLLMRADKRKIGKNGVQFFQSGWSFLHEAMSEFKGHEIEIRYSDNDWNRIFAVLPNGQIVEAERMEQSGVLNPNKKIMGVVARQRAKEQQDARNHLLVQQSNWRGETVEDRVQATLPPEEILPPEQQKMAVNARPTVNAISRFEKNKFVSSKPAVTTEMVESANVIEGMFGRKKTDSEYRIKDEWED